MGTWKHCLFSIFPAEKSEKREVFEFKKSMLTRNHLCQGDALHFSDPCQGDTMFQSQQWEIHCDKSFSHTPEGKKSDI